MQKSKQKTQIWHSVFQKYYTITEPSGSIGNSLSLGVPVFKLIVEVVFIVITEFMGDCLVKYPGIIPHVGRGRFWSWDRGD